MIFSRRSRVQRFKVPFSALSAPAWREENMTNNPPFIHLHVHTEYSLLDGAIRIDQMLEKCRQLEMNAAAITDHGNMFGAVQFYKEAEKAGIKPIIGCEAYVAPGDRRVRAPSPDGSPNAYHLILLVMNREGYKNLSKLVTLGHLEGFYYHPRLDMEILKEYNRGLIALSACLKGVVPYHINAGRMETANAAGGEVLGGPGSENHAEDSRGNPIGAKP